MIWCVCVTCEVFEVCGEASIICVVGCVGGVVRYVCGWCVSGVYV